MGSRGVAVLVLGLGLAGRGVAQEPQPGGPPMVPPPIGPPPPQPGPMPRAVGQPQPHPSDLLPPPGWFDSRPAGTKPMNLSVAPDGAFGATLSWVQPRCAVGYRVYVASSPEGIRDWRTTERVFQSDTLRAESPSGRRLGRTPPVADPCPSGVPAVPPQLTRVPIPERAAAQEAAREMARRTVHYSSGPVLVPGLPYYYWVAAFYRDSAQGLSDAATVTTRPPAFSVSAVALSPTAVRLTWPRLDGAADYRVYRDGQLRPPAGLMMANPAPQYVDPATPGSRYSYVVEAVFPSSYAGSEREGIVRATTTITTPTAPPPVASVKPSDVFFAGSTNEERARTNSKNAAYIIARDVEIAGWLLDTAKIKDVRDDTMHLGANPQWNAPEDYHYFIVPDVAFIETHYGARSPLAQAFLPGHGPAVLIPKEIPFVGETEDRPADPAKRLRFDDVAPDGTSRGVTVNSFWLPGEITLLEGELNAWWVNDTIMADPQPNDPNHVIRVKGRGPPPANWYRDPSDANGHLYWPFNPLNPDGTGDLTPGTYVILRGTLFEDSGHIAGWACGNLGGFFCGRQDQAACWNTGSIPPDPPAWPTERPVSAHGGWIEIHPTDAVRRAQPASGALKSARVVALCAPVELTDASRLQDFTLTPIQPRPAGTVVSYTELIDGRFTDMRTVDEHVVTKTDDYVSVHVKVHSSGTLSMQAKEGRFKAAYVLWWETPTATAPPQQGKAKIDVPEREGLRPREKPLEKR